MQQLNSLQKSLIEALSQVLELITLTEHKYGRPSQFSISPIGKHVRHIVDHLWAFREGVENGCLDYNIRHRETKLESEAILGHSAIDNLISWLKSSELVECELSIVSEISVNHKVQVRVPSNINRELIYLINHTLHHVAYACILARTMDIETPEYLGLAPATVTNLREQISKTKETVMCAQ